MDNIFGRVNQDGNINVLFADSGERVTKMSDSTLYPIDSQTSVCYEHPEGIVISREDADRIGLDIE